MSGRTSMVASLGWSLCAALCPAQEPAGDAAVEPSRDELVEHLATEGVVVDLEQATITIDALVNVPMDPLEYLLIHPRGKNHEALFISEVKPSLLNTAFLLLGFEPGENASYEPIEPPPTQEEVAAGADWVKIFPPVGMPVWITVSWAVGEEGEKKAVAVDDLILDMTTGKAVEDHEWIFLGGRMAPLYRGEPPVFVADFEGNVMSLCYLTPQNHLVTMKHERARDDQIWWRTELCPDPETRVELRFHKTKPALVVEREKRLAGAADDRADK